ncbi:MAG: prohibitin family protein [Planctomycetes bacterium]|nr:prohibitin family protein [Planctomycetota bacterium]
MNSEQTRIVKLAGGAVLGIFALTLMFSCWEIVDPGNRGVYVSLGEVEEKAYEEGFHMKFPWDKIEEVEVKQLKAEEMISASSKDLQAVTATVAVNYHVEYDKVWRIYKEVGQNELTWINVLIKPRVQETTKAVTAKFSAEELITRRADAKKAIRDGITEELAKQYIRVVDVSITNFDFSAEFNRAIESKQKAEQDALKAKNELEKEKIDAQRQVEQAKAEKEARQAQADAKAYETTKQAEAEAEAQNKMAQVLKENPHLMRWRWLEKWDGVLPKVMGGDNIDILIPMSD